jgi:hypothetical protein
MGNYFEDRYVLMSHRGEDSLFRYCLPLFSLKGIDPEIPRITVSGIFQSPARPTYVTDPAPVAESYGGGTRVQFHALFE